MMLATSGLALAIYQPAAAACEHPPVATGVCDGVAPHPARNLGAFNSGVYQGNSIVEQIWRSPAINQDPDKFDLLNTLVQNTIKPLLNGTLARTDIDDFVRCRVQGMLEAVLCKLDDHDPTPGCQWNGAFWGELSAGIYCASSIALGGLVNEEPWFVRTPPGICGTNFENFCQAVYKYDANSPVYPLAAEMQTALAALPFTPATLPVACAPYTIDDPTTGNYLTVFNNRIYIDCSYVIPSP